MQGGLWTTRTASARVRLAKRKELPMNIDVAGAIVRGTPVKVKVMGSTEALDGLWNELISFKKRQGNDAVSLNMMSPQIGATWIDLTIMVIPEELRGPLIEALTRSLHGPCTFQIDGQEKPA